MGREIRRVPPGWEHPRGDEPRGGGYTPLFDGAKFAESTAFFEAHEAEWRAAYGEDLGGETRPDPADYTPAWSAGEATGWCVYETVTEGTPISPVFTEPEALVAWLVEQGYSPEAAANFAVDGWVPTFMTSGGVLYADIESAVLRGQS